VLAGVRHETVPRLRHAPRRTAPDNVTTPNLAPVPFDGVFDFDAAVKDPAYPSRIKPDQEAPDHIHLNPKGYEAAAAVIPLSALDSRLPK